MLAIAGGEYQVIETAKLRKEGCNGSFVRDVDRLPLCFATDTLNGLLNSFRIAGDDNDLGSLRGRLSDIGEFVSCASLFVAACFQYPTVKRCRTWVGRSSSSIIATA
jgi:hypothetical protein